MRGLWLFGVGVLIAIIAAVWWRSTPSTERTNPPEAVRASAADNTPRAAAGGLVQSPPIAGSNAPSAPQPPNIPPGASPPDIEGDVPQTGWAAVDLEEVRKALPDNLYWKLSAPTTDPDLLEWREAERDRLNTEYGKVLSGTASEEDIRTYFDERARRSGDSVEFATYVLDHYGDKLPEQDVGLLTLARRLHLARLEEVPRKVEEALQRKRQQDAAREAWLADQAQFGGGEPKETDAGESSAPRKFRPRI